jgi:hypothetical protein
VRRTEIANPTYLLTSRCIELQKISLGGDENCRGKCEQKGVSSVAKSLGAEADDGRNHAQVPLVAWNAMRAA